MTTEPGRAGDRAGVLAGLPIEVVDVFAAAPLEGNPLAVVTVDAFPDAALRQAVARETNLAETTFVARRPDAEGHWPVHIHTPAEELPFAGHPVLGTAWVVRERLARGADRLTLATGRGPVTVRFAAGEGGDRRAGRGATGWFRAPEVRLEAMPDTAPWCEALQLAPAELTPERAPPAIVDVGPRFVVLQLATRSRLAAIVPDAARLAQRLGARRATGVLLVAPAAAGEGDLAVRMFFDAHGLREDPGTGSAAAGLAALLRSAGYTGRLEITQGVELGRRSRLHLEIEETGIALGGAVLPVYAGRFAS